MWNSTTGAVGGSPRNIDWEMQRLSWLPSWERERERTGLAFNLKPDFVICSNDKQAREMPRMLTTVVVVLIVMLLMIMLIYIYIYRGAPDQISWPSWSAPYFASVDWDPTGPPLARPWWAHLGPRGPGLINKKSERKCYEHPLENRKPIAKSKVVNKETKVTYTHIEPCMFKQLCKHTHVWSVEKFRDMIPAHGPETRIWICIEATLSSNLWLRFWEMCPF